LNREFPGQETGFGGNDNWSTGYILDITTVSGHYDYNGDRGGSYSYSYVSGVTFLGGGGIFGGLAFQAGGGGGGAPSPDCGQLLTNTGLSGLTSAIVTAIRGVNSDPNVEALVAQTWSSESGFSNQPNNNINVDRRTGQNGIASGNVDIGPMQINYKTWAATFSSNNVDVFGTNLGSGAFDGDATANLAAGAVILENLYAKFGDDAAGYYRTGTGAFSKTRYGQEQYNFRQGIYNQHKNALRALFGSECFK
jgi:hypothetical protein